VNLLSVADSAGKFEGRRSGWDPRRLGEGTWSFWLSWPLSIIVMCQHFNLLIKLHSSPLKLLIGCWQVGCISRSQGQKIGVINAIDFFFYLKPHGLELLYIVYRYVKPLSHQSGVLTVFTQRLKKLQNAEVRAVQTPAMLCKRCAIAYNAMQRHLFWACSKQTQRLGVFTAC